MKTIVLIADFRVLTLVNIKMYRIIIVIAAVKKLMNSIYMMMDVNYAQIVYCHNLRRYKLPTS